VHKFPGRSGGPDAGLSWARLERREMTNANSKEAPENTKRTPG
jgi:hypothetical protein